VAANRDTGRGRDEVKIKFTLQPFLYDLHMKQAKNAAAEAEVLTVSDSEHTECSSVSDRSYWAQTTNPAGRTETVHLCLVTLVDPAVDGLLQIGSCVELIDTSDESVDVYEHHCDDDSVTHEVIADVPEGKDCPMAADYNISKSDAEVEDSGAGRWCMAER
jgi:hypothetical protein